MATAKLRAGRSWSVTRQNEDDVITSLTRPYIIYLDANPSGTAVDEVTSCEGLPEIGDAHPSNENLVVVGYDFQEGEYGAKRVLKVSVKYSSATQSAEGGGQATTESYAVTQWGWAASSVSRDLTHDVVTGLPVLNSVGDPFDSVPQVDRPSPMFTKVVKFKSRQSGWMELNDKVNDEEVTIGDISCPEGTLRATVAYERLWNDVYGFKFQYTINLQFLSNPVKLGDDEEATDIGWDVAMVDQGCYELVNGEKKRITEKDADGNDVPVSLPVLLDGSGQYTRTGEPYVKRVKAYERASFPSEFYSEPAQ